MNMECKEFLSRLEGVKQTSGGWEALCPAHEDMRPSLSIARGDDGRILVSCHAGCSTSEVVSAMELKLSDLFPEKPRRMPPKQRIIASYDYRDLDGNLVCQKVRLEPKGFYQRRPGPDGAWTNNLNNVGRVLYKLQDVKGHILLGEGPLFLTEGEKDADALQKIGLLGTTNIEGALKWNDRYTETLRGADVVVIADKDDVGRKHSNMVAGKLYGTAASVKVIELPDRNGKTVKDTADWIAAGGTREELLKLAADVEKYSGENKSVILDARDYMAMAVSCLETDSYPHLKRYRECWYVYEDGCYREVPDENLKGGVRRFLEKAILFSADGNVVKPSQRIVTETTEALKSICILPQTIEPPCWLKKGMPDPKCLISFKNGLLDLETDVLQPHSPDLFSMNCLQHDYDPSAGCSEWLKFIKEVSHAEEDWEAALQLWFGYNLVPDTSQQKMMLFVGPPRSGKGITCRILQAVLGKHNYVNPTLHSLGSSFGLAPLMGKLAAICPDAHVGRGTDAVMVMEQLKGIIGEDSVSINRKYKVPVNVKLTARFTASVNELPSFPDASGSMKARIIVLPFRDSHEGKEDRGLFDRLATEVSGISNWAMAGLKELQETGSLIQPESGMEIIEDFAALSSPVLSFVTDWCVINEEETVTCSDLYGAWSGWCEKNGHKRSSRNRFGVSLKAAFPQIERVREYSDGTRPWTYKGIGLNTSAENFTTCVNAH